ncbi:hypothetical protein FIBSPDRAFT_1049522 [Athelia psychrophila]|uniref:Uncharacterized protein n=1 Tax=Athelia psychrophila TaxID=1759441 RepID=A0A166C4V3_9AGAM|nr:hypothetical protein FIBSPDRAFT_1049522 [Fibularhizoctonia sp. CBS 109695]
MRDWRAEHETSSTTGASAFTSSVAVGINPECDTLLAGSCIPGEHLACAAHGVLRGAGGPRQARKAPVGRIETRIFLALYALCHPFQLGSTPLVALTGTHVGILAALCWSLLANGIVATQVVEDWSASGIIPFTASAVAFFAATTYIAHHTIPVFVLTSIWHAAATAIYLVLVAYIVGVLNEVRPMWFYVPSGVLFVLSQPDYFLLNKLICKGMNAKIDGSFVASICETAVVGVVYLARRGITKESWDDEYPVQEDYFPRSW